MLVTLRLTLRRLALEALVCLAASIVITLGGYLLARIVATARTPEAVQAWMGLVPYAKEALLVAPIVAAIVLGTSLAASEIERGNAAFAWSIALDRRRWLAETAAAGALLALVVSIPLAWASAELGAALGPLLDARTSGWIDPAWPLVLARPLVAYALAWLAGLLVGRSLPALLAVILAAAVVIGSLELGFAAGRSAVAISIDPATPATFWVSDAVRLTDGRIVPVGEATALTQPVPGVLSESMDPQYIAVTLGLSPELRQEEPAIEIAGSLAAACVVLIGAVIVLGRRRPG